MIRKMQRFLLIVLALQALIHQGDSAATDFCNIYLLNMGTLSYGLGLYTGGAPNDGTTFTTTDIPERNK